MISLLVGLSMLRNWKKERTLLRLISLELAADSHPVRAFVSNVSKDSEVPRRLPKLRPTAV